MKNGIWLLVAGVAAYYLYRVFSTVSNLNFVPRGISVGNGGLSLQLGVQNITNTSLQFNGFSGSVLINGNNVGNVADFQPQILAANGESQVLFFFTPNLLGLAQQLVNLFQGGSLTGMKVQLQGTANVEGQAVPVDVNFN